MSTQTKPKITPSKVTKLKLSEAIRLGAALRPQCRWHLFKDGASCALGAATEAVGLFSYSEGRGNGFKDIMRYFGIPGLIIMKAWQMNDSGQTREQIADWLEGQGL